MRRQIQKKVQIVTIHMISQFQVIKCYDPARQTTRFLSKFTRTAMNEQLEARTKGFHRFSTRRTGFSPVP